VPNDVGVALITGAADGIGWAIAQTFAAKGYHVGLCDRDAEKVTARALTLGPRHLAVTADVTSEADVLRMVAEIVERFGGVTALVNNAGIGSNHVPTVDQTLADFQRVLSVHLDGTFLVSREVARVMLAQGGGTIVNIGSVAGLLGMPRRNAYAAAKAGIAMMTKDMACEWAAGQIRVNAVAPGYVYTDLVKKLEQEGTVDLEKIRRRTPMGRLGEPQEIADAVFFLSSPEARFITGAILSVDGGWAAFGGSGDASNEAPG
jgi:NAD(P)-dependent dehydrogenase (short-subunit alcohol dehydrogenase family)